MNSLSDWYSNTIAELNNIKNTLLQNLRTYVNDSVTSLNGLYLQMATTIQNYVNQAKDYAEQAQVTVDNRVSKSYLIDSNAFESGAIGNNILVLADIKKYAHSTYCGDQAEGSTPGYLSDGVTPLDPKKFIKVGSPTITNDGIASGFSGSNYLIANISIDRTKPWEVCNVLICTDI